MIFGNYILQLLIIFVPAVIIAITLHEFAHALVGHYLGDDTARLNGRLSLNPLVHIDPFLTLLLPLALILSHSPVVFGAARPVPFNPWAVRYGKWGSAMIAAAGPLTNLLVASFLAAWLRIIPLSSTAQSILIDFISVNVGFFVFNLIPFPPLDGSRVLYAVAPLGLRSFMDRIEQMGFPALLLFLVLVYPIILPVVSGIVVLFLGWLIPNPAGI
jgi:Zn-dependent protease